MQAPIETWILPLCVIAAGAALEAQLWYLSGALLAAAGWAVYVLWTLGRPQK